MVLVFSFCLFSLASSGSKEVGYMQIGSQSDDPFVLMKVLTYKSRYEEVLSDSLSLQFDEAESLLLKKFSDEIEAYYALAPEIWETDELFYERVEKEYHRLNDAILTEVEKVDFELHASHEQQLSLIDGFAHRASTSLEFSRTLTGRSLSMQSQSYDRNARTWLLSVSSRDAQVPFESLPIAIDFTTIGDESTTRAEIINFDEAVRKNVLEVSVGWHFRQDFSFDRFLLIVDFLSITNPLTGGTFAINLDEPILIKTYAVTGETIDTLMVKEASQDPMIGIGNLSYVDESWAPYALSSPKETVYPAWGVERQVFKPISSADSSIAPAKPISQRPVTKEEVVFHIANGAEPESLDPALIQGVPDHRIYMSLFEGLVAIDPKTALAIPGVAESWTISDDMTQYTFKLRKNALWSDGKPITAHDVVYSWLRILDPATASPYAWFPCMFISGAEDYNCGAAGPKAVKIRALDDYTFQMNLIGPLPYALDALTHYSFAIVPKHAIEKFGSVWTDPANFVGNGPFVLTNRVAQTSITVSKNPTYWDKDNVKLDKVIFYSSDSTTTNYNMYLNGEIDWATNVPPDQLAAAQMRDDFKIAPQLATYYYVFQNDVAPINNVLVRKALALAIDREALVEGITKAGQIPAWGIVPTMAGYDALTFPYGTQKEAILAARALLSKAGYPNGTGFPTISILYNTDEGHKQIAQFIQQEWKNNLGLRVTLVNQEWQTYLSNRNQGLFTVARAGWVGDYADPNTFLDMFVSGSGMNGGRYDNEVYDLLINESARMHAGAERMGTLRVAEDIMINQDQGILPLYYYVTKNMIDTDKWGGWYTNIMDYHPTKALYRK